MDELTHCWKLDLPAGEAPDPPGQHACAGAVRALAGIAQRGFSGLNGSRPPDVMAVAMIVDAPQTTVLRTGILSVR
ncbi:hypothetical protein [Cupriavidus laharis]|uniref:hypothetical protein n=1 Tax=Cupriavidus laharis TaxID=151654 RepID=UPI001CC5EB19|nr:hypothetical protein [Cupriavidus laharis]